MEGFELFRFAEKDVDGVKSFGSCFARSVARERMSNPFLISSERSGGIGPED